VPRGEKEAYVRNEIVKMGVFNCFDKSSLVNLNLNILQIARCKEELCGHWCLEFF
jgi:hypothetical protein